MGKKEELGMSVPDPQGDPKQRQQLGPDLAAPTNTLQDRDNADLDMNASRSPTGEEDYMMFLDNDNLPQSGNTSLPTRTDTATDSDDVNAARFPTGDEEYMMFLNHEEVPPPLANESLPPPTYQDSMVTNVRDQKAQLASSTHREDSMATSAQDEKAQLASSTAAPAAAAATITTPTIPSSSSNNNASSSKTPPPTFHFYKSSTVRTKNGGARLRSTDGREFRLAADIHRSTASTIQLYSDCDQDETTTCLGSVIFTPNSNSFQVMTSGARGTTAPADLIQVRAKVGVPHPQSYTFTLKKGREVEWTKMDGNGFGYRMRDTTWQGELARWELVLKDKENKFDAVLRFLEHPRDERETILWILSFVGSYTRLKVKGRDMSGMHRSGRWGAFWYMAVLGTAGMADF